FILAAGKIMEYAVSDPDDISTAVYVTEIAFSFGQAFHIDEEQGETLIIYSSSTNDVHQYALSTPWSLTGATDTGNTVDMSVVAPFNAGVADVKIIPSLSILYCMGVTGVIYRADITGGDISTATNVTAMSGLPSDAGAFEATSEQFDYFGFSPNGMRLYL